MDQSNHRCYLYLSSSVAHMPAHTMKTINHTESMDALIIFGANGDIFAV